MSWRHGMLRREERRPEGEQTCVLGGIFASILMKPRSNPGNSVQMKLSIMAEQFRCSNRPRGPLKLLGSKTNVVFAVTKEAVSADFPAWTQKLNVSARSRQWNMYPLAMHVE
jgi:hypothetical protein